MRCCSRPMSSMPAALATLNFGRLKDELLADAGPGQLSTIARRKTGTTKRKRSTEVAAVLDERIGFESGAWRGAPRDLGEHSSSHVLRRCRGVGAVQGAGPITPARQGLPGEKGVLEGGSATADRRVRVGEWIQYILS